MGWAYGGHVLCAGVVSGNACIASEHRVELELPGNDNSANSVQTKDRTQKLHSVERPQQQKATASLSATNVLQFANFELLTALCWFGSWQ